VEIRYFHPDAGAGEGKIPFAGARVERAPKLPLEAFAARARARGEWSRLVNFAGRWHQRIITVQADAKPNQVRRVKSPARTARRWFLSTEALAWERDGPRENRHEQVRD